MLSIGLTGSIATGKSTVLALFAEHGVPVFSADEAVHGLYSGSAAEVVENLFPGVVRDGTVDRAELSRRLIENPSDLGKLEAAVHPLVRGEIARFLAEAGASGAKLAVVDIPLLFESGYDCGLDRVAVTVCPEEVQRSRALARPGMTVEKFNTILARQMSQEDKRKRADYVFDTSHELAYTRSMVAALVAAIWAKAK